MQRKKAGTRCSIEFCENKSDMKTVSFFHYPADLERRKIWIQNCMYQENIDFDSKNLSSLRVCGDHFESRMFLNRRTKNRLVFNAVPTLFSDEILIKRNKAKKRTIYSDLIKDNDDDICDELQDDQDINECLKVQNRCSILCSSYNDRKSLVSSCDFSCQTPRSIAENTPRIFKLKFDLKGEKQKVRQLEKTVVYLSQQLTKYESAESVLKLCEKYLTPGTFRMVKSVLTENNNA